MRRVSKHAARRWPPILRDARYARPLDEAVEIRRMPRMAISADVARVPAECERRAERNSRVQRAKRYRRRLRRRAVPVAGSPGTRGSSGGRPVNNRELTGSGSRIARHCTPGMYSGWSAGIAAAQPQRPCAAARQRAAQPLTQICERAESAPDSGYSQLQNEATRGLNPRPCATPSSPPRPRWRRARAR